MSRQIVLLGVDYRHAALAAREQLSFTPAEQRTLLEALQAVSGVAETLLLCTCNRTELYVAFSGNSPVPGLLGALKSFRPKARAVCEESIHTMELDDHAVMHLFRVAAGVDSQNLGDTNIVMQVKQAYRTAAEAGTLGPLLDRTVTESLRASKRARRETAIGRGAASVGAAVLRTLREHYGKLTGIRDAGIRALMLGAGEAGQDIARHLAKVGFTHFAFAARNPHQAAAMARAFSGTMAAWDDVPQQIAVCDVVIAATPARLAFLEKNAIEEALRSADRSRCTSGVKQLLIIDAGVPRNADPDAANIPGVRVLDLDAFVKEGGEARAAREREVPRVEAILLEEMERWTRWWKRYASETRPVAGSSGAYATGSSSEAHAGSASN